VAETPAGPDSERVRALREQSLLRAGFLPEHASDLARRDDVDLQSARALVDHGFPPEVAYQMLVSGRRPVF
jgi:hypothetical protein